MLGVSPLKTMGLMSRYAHACAVNDLALMYFNFGFVYMMDKCVGCQKSKEVSSIITRKLISLSYLKYALLLRMLSV